MSPTYRPFALVLLAAAGTFAVTMGARMSMGLFVGDINSATGLGLVSVSLAFAIGQLWWGLTQPVAGIVADRVGAGRALVVGVLLVAIGTALIPHMSSTLGLAIAVGVLSAGGAGIAGPAVLMAAVNRLVEPRRRGLASGIVNAGGSFGQFIFAPTLAAIAVVGGWTSAIYAAAAIALLALPLAWVLRGDPPTASGPGAAPRQTTREAIAQAFANPSYRLLATGFFVCGFHVAFLGTHLPGVIAACGLPAQVAGWAIALIGLFNIAGSLAMGWAIGSGRWQLKSMLSLLYVTRGVAVLIFLLAPKTTANVLIFSAAMGATFLSTVPATAQLVARFFGPAHMATLFGIVMVTHQIGGFLGAWLGGWTFARYGSYDLFWIADILLAGAAALVHLPIREPAAPRPAAA